MKAEIITIGDEILIGQITDTNSVWLGQELSKIGIAVIHRASVSDQRNDILNALRDATQRADIIILTGGLGPTKDDVTKQSMADFFNSKLVSNKEVLEWVEQIFKKRNLPMLESNTFQAMVPSNCEILFNKNGTAPGMWFHENGKIYISMPGVPFEMKSMFTELAIPKLKQHFDLPVILHRTILTCSIGESFLAKRIENLENNLPPHIKLAYLPSIGMVRLRFSGRHTEQATLQHEMATIVNNLYELAGEYIYGEEEQTLQQVVGDLLKSKQATLSTAESCTGGYIAQLITSIPGSSAYYTGSIVSYANAVKINELGVSEEILKTVGAVSEACVKQMAEGIKTKMNTTYSIATSGIAGPDGGTPQKPVGTVWIAVSGPQGTIAQQFSMGDSRIATIQRSSFQGLDMLRKILLGK